MENIEENGVTTKDIPQCWKGIKWRWHWQQGIGDQKQKVEDGGEVALNRAHISKMRQRGLKTEVAGGGEVAPAKQDFCKVI